MKLCLLGRQDSRAAVRRGASPSTDDRGGGHEGLPCGVFGREEAKGDQRGAGGLLHDGGQMALKVRRSGSLGITLSNMLNEQKAVYCVWDQLSDMNLKLQQSQRWSASVLKVAPRWFWVGPESGWTSAAVGPQGGDKHLEMRGVDMSSTLQVIITAWTDGRKNPAVADFTALV